MRHLRCDGSAGQLNPDQPDFAPGIGGHDLTLGSGSHDGLLGTGFLDTGVAEDLQARALVC